MFLLELSQSSDHDKESAQKAYSEHAVIANIMNIKRRIYRGTIGNKHFFSRCGLSLHGVHLF